MANKYDTPVLPSQLPPPHHVQKMIDEVLAVHLPGSRAPRRETLWNRIQRCLRTSSFLW